MLFPDADISFLVTPETSVLLKNNPLVDRVFEFDKRKTEKGSSHLVKWIKNLSEEKFDYAVVPHRSLRSALIVWGAKIPIRIGFNKSSGFFLFNKVVEYPVSVHEVERNFTLLENLGWKGQIPGPVLYPGVKERREVEMFLGKAGVSPRQELIAIAPGSVWPTKRWPVEYFIETTRSLWNKQGIRSILIGGKEDKELGDLIVSGSEGGAVSAMGKFSLLSSAEIIRRCRVTISNDSAPEHISAAVGTPVVAIFGPTTPDFGFYPWGNGHTILYKGIKCSPCGIHGGKKCPKRHFNCMNLIKPDEVIESVIKYLK